MTASPYQPVPATQTGGAAPTTPAGARNLIIGGIVAGVAGLVLGVVSLVMLVSGVVGAVGDQLTAPVNVYPGTATVTLDTGQYLVFQDSFQSLPLSSDSITVHGPDGEPVPLRYPPIREELQRPEGHFVAVAAFDASQAGAYQIEVSDLTGVNGTFVVAHGIGSTVTGRAGWAVGIGVGGLLVVLGIVLVAVGLTQRRKARAVLAPAYTGPYPAGYGYQQQPYGFPPQPAPQPTAPQPAPTPEPAPQPAVAPGPPPGWYPDPDPSRPGGQRYWDGSSWTTHTA